MDEILVANFMVFHDLVRDEPYDLWIGDEAWELDYFLHENPELKSAAYVWLSDFVGWLPMDEGGEREAFLTGDYNAEMLEQIARYPRVRDRSLFVGDPEDVVATRFGAGLPSIRAWTERHFAFTGYITGFDPATVADREALRAELGYGAGDRVCIATVGGSGVGEHLLAQVIASYPEARRLVPGLRMIVVAGPRIDPDTLPSATGLEVRPLRSRPVPPPGRVRPRDRARRAFHHDGADRHQASVHLLPARAPLRAEPARPPPARALRRGAADGVGAAAPLKSSPRRSRRRSVAPSTTGRSRPTAQRAPPS